MSSRGGLLGFDASNADGWGPFQRYRRISGVAGSRQAGSGRDEMGTELRHPAECLGLIRRRGLWRGQPEVMLAAVPAARDL